MQFVLDERDNGEEQVGQQPSYGEGQQHTAEVAEQQEDANGEQTVAQPAHKSVESDGFVICQHNDLIGLLDK